MGVFTCLVLSVAATLAFSLYRAYRGTCQLAADLQVPKRRLGVQGLEGFGV